MKGKIFSFLSFNVFEFGDQKVSQFIIFEHKRLFSIIFFYFHKSNKSQDRFHTHAFNAISFKLFGKYTEYILTDEKIGKYYTKDRIKIIQYFPRNSFHKIGNSTGCATLLFSGPWKKTWKEYYNNKVIEYKWNRFLK